MKAHIISASFYKRWATIAAFTQECHEVSKSKGWLEKPCTHAQIANLMVSELSEALEDYRVAADVAQVYYEQTAYNKEGGKVTQRVEQLLPGEELSKAKPCGIPVELADFLIRVGQHVGTAGLSEEFDLALDNEHVTARVDLNDAMADAMKHVSDFYWAAEQSTMQHWVPIYLARATKSILLYCATTKIDIWHWVILKNEYNKTRSHRHGGKVI